MISYGTVYRLDGLILLFKGQLFDIAIPANSVWIHSIQITPAESNTEFEFLLWDRQQEASRPPEESSYSFRDAPTNPESSEDVRCMA